MLTLTPSDCERVMRIARIYQRIIEVHQSPQRSEIARVHRKFFGPLNLDACPV